MIAIKNILVPTDFGAASDAALMYGRELAGRFNAVLHLVHVAENLQLTSFAEAWGDVTALQRDIERAAAKELDDRLADSDGSGPKTSRAVLASIAPATAIADYARDHRIDLIVMGTHGRGAVAHSLMGSVAERVVRIAPCPVLTVRQRRRHDFVRPDTPAVVRTAGEDSRVP
jgi:nucleotide-binding universal stress UspA family protein